MGQTIMRYIKDVFSSISELLNVILGGYKHETLCVRVWRSFPDTWLSRLVDAIFFLDTKHCRKAYYYNEIKKKTAEEIEERFKNYKSLC
jgi:hypothetical protein